MAEYLPHHGKESHQKSKLEKSSRLHKPARGVMQQSPLQGQKTVTFIPEKSSAMASFMETSEFKTLSLVDQHTFAKALKRVRAEELEFETALSDLTASLERMVKRKEEFLSFLKEEEGE